MVIMKSSLYANRVAKIKFALVSNIVYDKCH